ncbi:putative SWI5-dependent HO expression protein 3 [[Candida] railenensis]|uniref:SWI5-dependent HO expression protein 3 n=1 Tax=[Candida] railenensis TaxID=45579 RepID=A0A9P0VVD9_9ASCO|nr:putative SWI5-dependent HO expression protein 3 [[Candida] railenensis]
MEEGSPVKQKGTSSRVIDSLHTTIDDLKEELDSVKISHDDYKKKYTSASKKNDSFVDQLANAKHENDMVHALLKRKERRIVDLEDQFNDLCSNNESLKLNFKNMKIRCENLQESSASSTAEYERLKIAYDALLASQLEYKRHYSSEITNLTTSFEQYKKQNEEKLNKIAEQFQSNDKDVEILLDSLTNKKKALETLYVNKNKTVLELLGKLSKVAKLHGQESKTVLVDVVESMEELLEKYPELPNKIQEHEKIEVDISEILSESNETLLANCSFDEEQTLVNSPDPGSEPRMKGQQHQQHQIKSDTSNQNQQQPGASRRRKNKRSSLRIDSNNAPDFSSVASPNQSQFNLPKRNFNLKSSDSKTRAPTPPSNSNVNGFQNSSNNNNNNINNSNNSYQRRNNSGNNYNHHNGSNNYNNNSNNSNSNFNSNSNSNNSNTNNRSKRRSMYGQSNGNNGNYNNYKGNRQSFHEQQAVNL